jgi:hypothetical protein
MRTPGIALLVLIILVSVSLLTVWRTLPPTPLPASAPALEFSAARALEHVRVIAQQPHPTGSAANHAVRQYILAQLKTLGLETQTQRDGDLENVVGRLVGKRSSNAVLLTAHLDSVAESSGATDDGSGVAVLLETARALTSAGPTLNSVMVLFTDFEEGGAVGARAFIAHHAWARDVRIVIGLDAGGLSGPGVLSATSPDDGWLIQQLAEADPYLIGSSAINALAESDTDFGHAFRPAGFSGYAFDLYWDRRIHSPADSLENLDLASLQHQGDHALSLARHFAALGELTDPKQPNVVYFTVLRLFTVLYPVSWALPLATFVVAIFGCVLAMGLRQRILTWRGMGYGLFVGLVGVVIAPLPSLLLGQSMPDVPFRFIGRALNQPPQVAVVALVSLVLVVLWFALARRFRRTSLPDLTMGALLLMGAGMVGTSLAFPALSFALTWPLLLSLLACAYRFYWSARHKNVITVVVGFLIAGAATIIILGPTILLGLFDQLSLTLLLVGSLCGFLVPLIHLMWGGTTGNLVGSPSGS